MIRRLPTNRISRRVAFRRTFLAVNESDPAVVMTGRFSKPPLIRILRRPK
jgi:hypothetical protein